MSNAAMAFHRGHYNHQLGADVAGPQVLASDLSANHSDLTIADSARDSADTVPSATESTRELDFRGSTLNLRGSVREDCDPDHKLAAT